MKHSIIVFVLSILIGCTYHPKEKQFANFSNNDGQILKSYYKLDEDTINFRRILSNKSELILQCGQIFLGKYGLTHQLIREVETLKKHNGIIDSLTTSYSNEGFTTKLGEDKDVMFVQIIPDSVMSNFQSLGFLNLRHEIEEKIDERLKTRNLGEWFAGDMGAGGNVVLC